MADIRNAEPVQPRSRRKRATAVPDSGVDEESSASQSNLPPIRRERAIAEIAYVLAERRGFAPGYELDDWLAAEKEVDRQTSGGPDESSASQ